MFQANKPQTLAPSLHEPSYQALLQEREKWSCTSSNWNFSHMLDSWSRGCSLCLPRRRRRMTGIPTRSLVLLWPGVWRQQRGTGRTQGCGGAGRDPGLGKQGGGHLVVIWLKGSPYPFISGWIPGLFPYLGYCKSCYNKCKGACIFSKKKKERKEKWPKESYQDLPPGCIVTAPRWKQALFLI